MYPTSEPGPVHVLFNDVTRHGMLGVVDCAAASNPHLRKADAVPTLNEHRAGASMLGETTIDGRAPNSSLKLYVSWEVEKRELERVNPRLSVRSKLPQTA